MAGWTVTLYTTAAGRCPVRDYLGGLAPHERARVTVGIDLLETFGLALGMPHVRSVGDKLWELRVRGQVQHRVLYVAATGERLVLLHAFSKKTSQIPAAELRTAKRRMADYTERMG